MKKLYQNTVVVIYQVSKFAGILALIFLMGIMLLTVADVVMRYFFNAPIPGTTELTIYCVIVAGFLGLSWCAVQKAHLKVDILINYFPVRVRKIINIVMLVLAMTVVPLVAWQSFAQSEIIRMEHVLSDFLKIPAFPFYIIIGISFTLLGLVVITLIVDMIRQVINNEP
jgi:TRAP-type C4-dicarboxylate transport system permease small subunit